MVYRIIRVIVGSLFLFAGLAIIVIASLYIYKEQWIWIGVVLLGVVLVFVAYEIFRGYKISDIIRDFIDIMGSWTAP